MALHLAGAVMLLIWAVRMVRTGVERAHGAALRRAMHRSKGSRLGAAGIGTATALLLQSSTAVAMLAAGFTAGGVLNLSTGLAVLLGADLGSALAVRILSLDLAWLTPILLIFGGGLFLRGTSRGVKQMGRILTGIALILISLNMIGTATTSLREGSFLPVVVGYLQKDFITAFVLCALFTWLLHSSIASVLLLVVLSAQNVLPVELALSMMLGANLGGGLIAVGLTRGAEVRVRRLPLGNLAFRSVGAVLALFAIQAWPVPLHMVGGTAAQQIVNLHVGFNVALTALGLPLTGVVGALLCRLMPDPPIASELGSAQATRTSALDRSALRSPRLALTSATRELLYMAEIVEAMLSPVMDFYESGDLARIKRVRKLEKEVNRIHSEIKFYLAELAQHDLCTTEANRSRELTRFAINLAHVGDIVAKNLLKLAEEKHAKQLAFSGEGWRELTELHHRVVANLQLALNVLVSIDQDSARQLVEEKDRLRDLERESHDSHLRRLESGTIESLESSDIHLETVRALRQVNSALASVAYPILSEGGALLRSRLA